MSDSDRPVINLKGVPLSPEILDNGRAVASGEYFCWKHGNGGPCDCKPSNCCSRYTHGCGPVNHKFFDPDLNGA